MIQKRVRILWLLAAVTGLKAFDLGGIVGGIGDKVGDITGSLGLDKITDLASQGVDLTFSGLDQLADITQLTKVGDLASQGIDLVQDKVLTPMQGLALNVINQVDATALLKKMGVPGDAANIIGMPFDVVNSLGKEALRIIVNLPKKLADNTKMLIGLVTDPEKAAEMLKRWLALFEKLATMKPSVHLCHGECGTDILLRNIAISQPLVDALVEIRKFLEKEKDEVLFIFFEDYILDGEKIDKIIENAKLDKYIVGRKDWDLYKGWPTFGWARKNNKRLFIFTGDRGTDKNSKYVWFMRDLIAEGKYSSIGDLGKKGIERYKPVCVERGDSAEHSEKVVRTMNLLNLFPVAPIPIDSIKSGDILTAFNEYNKFNDSKDTNSKESLGNYIKACLTYGSGGKENQGYMKRYPNFIAVDFVDQGDALAVIDWINKKAQEACSGTLKEGGKQIYINDIFPPFYDPKKLKNPKLPDENKSCKKPAQQIKK